MTQHNLAFPKRLRSIAQLFFLLSLIFAGINALLFLLDSLNPDWFPKPLVGVGYVREIDSKVAAAEYYLSRTKENPPRPLCVVIGQSTMRSGISVPTLQSMTGSACQYLVLGGAGKSMGGMISSIEPFRRSNLKGEPVILGIHPYYLLDGKQILEGWVDPELMGTEGFSLRSVRAIRSSNWIVSRRADVAMKVAAQTDSLRRGIAPRLGIPRGVEVDPWAEPSWLHTNRSISREEILDLEEGLKETATSRMKAYRQSGKAVTAFVETLRRLRLKGMNVFVVFMPELSVMREQTPQEAMSAIIDPIRGSFSPSEVKIVNFRNLLPDSDFSDKLHYNLDGRRKLSQAFGELVDQWLNERSGNPSGTNESAPVSI